MYCHHMFGKIDVNAYMSIACSSFLLMIGDVCPAADNSLEKMRL